MSWKHTLQLLDLNIDARLEVRCLSPQCHHTRYVDVRELLRTPKYRQYYIDQIEKQMQCEVWGCRADCALMLVAETDTEGFQGGLA